MRGDILFFKGGPGLLDRLVQWRTNGPFVHVEVDLGDATAIGAWSRAGVNRHPVDAVNAVSYSLPGDIEAGIRWLLSHVGDPYGWVDILNYVFTTFIPRSPIVVSQRNGFDCSDLVARYIDIVDGLNLGTLLDTPSLISPNDLARIVGLI